MLQLKHVVVADASPLFRKLVTTLMKPHCGAVAAVSDAAGLGRVLAQRDESLSLLILSSDLPGDGMALFEELSAEPGPHPAVIVVVRQHDSDVETRASLLGAVGVLSKPVTFGAIRKVLSTNQMHGQPGAAPRARWCTPAKALVLAPGETWAEISFDVINLSETGALLATHGPLEIGDCIRLALFLGNTPLHVTVNQAGFAGGSIS